MPRVSNKTRYFLRDFGLLLKEAALEAKARAHAAVGSESYDYEIGRLAAYHEVATLLEQQAKAFGLPAEAISYEGFEPDNDLLGLRSAPE